MIGGQVGVQFHIGRKCDQGWNLVRLGFNGNRLIWIRDCGSEMVSIHTVRKGTTSFSNVNSLKVNTLELLD